MAIIILLGPPIGLLLLCFTNGLGLLVLGAGVMLWLIDWAWSRVLSSEEIWENFDP
jgi:hypothetical protein